MNTPIEAMVTLAQESVGGPLGASTLRVLAVLALVGVLFLIRRMIYAWAEVRQTREREETKREVAAYIAEGTMSPEVGERLINGDDAWRKRIADLVENQHLCVDDAERLLRAGRTGSGSAAAPDSTPIATPVGAA